MEVEAAPENGQLVAHNAPPVKGMPEYSQDVITKVIERANRELSHKISKNDLSRIEALWRSTLSEISVSQHDEFYQEPKLEPSLDPNTAKIPQCIGNFGVPLQNLPFSTVLQAHRVKNPKQNLAYELSMATLRKKSGVRRRIMGEGAILMGTIKRPIRTIRKFWKVPLTGCILHTATKDIFVREFRCSLNATELLDNDYSDDDLTMNEAHAAEERVPQENLSQASAPQVSVSQASAPQASPAAEESDDGGVEESKGSG